MRIAVIGSGISGNGAAWALTQPMQEGPRHEVTLYEARARAGGHSSTIDIDYQGKSLSVDIGFIVYNELNYPNLVALFDHLGVTTTQSDMSFAVSMGNGSLEWSGQSLGTIFAQKKNIFSPRFWRMIQDIMRFNKIAESDYQNNRLTDQSLRDYLSQHHFSQTFIDDYLAPMGSAIWSTPHADILDFPAKSFIRFFSNHRLMHPKAQRPRWRTVKGGSRSYVNKIIAPFQDKIRFDSKVVSVRREGGHIFVLDSTGHEATYDHVIFASHTDETLRMIKDADQQEQAVLSAIEYKPNIIYLHRDHNLMPKRQKVWSAWNYIEKSDKHQSDSGVCVSYSMNALQHIDEDCPLFVSLNPATPPREELTFLKTRFDHPQFNQAALNAQEALPTIQGKGNYWYCGAWSGYGFHEDGLKSGLAVAEKLGARIPWRHYPEAHHGHLAAAE